MKPSNPGQLSLGETPKRGDVTIIRNILVSEVAIILLPMLHQSYDDERGAVLKRVEELAPRIVDLCERRLRGLPGCGVCRDDGEVCMSCGLPKPEHEGPDTECGRWNPKICEACPFPELQRK